MKRYSTFLLFTSITAVLLGAVFELTLRIGAVLSSPVAAAIGRSPEPQVSRWVEDDVLGARPNPAYPGHDARGFRNPEAWDRVEVVVLGDSQTYGSGVGMEEAWPSRLRAMTGVRVYNMAYPSYGPLQESLLLEEALQLEPIVVVATLYAGNDLFDAFRHVYGGDWVPHLRSEDSAVVAEISRFEAEQPLVARAESSFRPPRGSTLRSLASRTATYALLRESRDILVGDAWVTWLARAEREPDRMRCLEAGGIRTVLTPPYRLTGLELDDPRIGEGLRLTLDALERMSAACAERGVCFLVVGIPTKELVHADLVDDVAEMGAAYVALLRNERELGARVAEFLAAREIEYLDSRPALSGPLARGDATYRESTDGHPSPRGHEVLAAATAERLRALGWIVAEDGPR